MRPASPHHDHRTLTSHHIRTRPPRIAPWPVLFGSVRSMHRRGPWSRLPRPQRCVRRGAVAPARCSLARQGVSAPLGGNGGRYMTAGQSIQLPCITCAKTGVRYRDRTSRATPFAYGAASENQPPCVSAPGRREGRSTRCWPTPRSSAPARLHLDPHTAIAVCRRGSTGEGQEASAGSSRC